MRAGAAILGLILGCAPHRAPDSPPTGRSRAPEVRYLPVPPPAEHGSLLVDAISGAQWDGQLARAVDELLLLSTSRTSPLDPRMTSLVTARAGFPGQARYARVLNGGAFPQDLANDIASAAQGEPVDVAIGVRRWADGTALWIAGWAPHRADLDPIPRDLPLDGTLAVRVELPSGSDEARLFVAPPMGPVEELSLTPGTPRWVDLFHQPGPYRLEVVAERGKQTEVALLFSVFVDSPPPEPQPGSPRPMTAPDPVAAEAALYRALDQLREERGLPPVKRFVLFEPLAREHSALMAAHGVVAHRLPGVTDGVPERARQTSYPLARHFENVAAASSAEDALALVVDSPGHLANLLCLECTHASIGVALEPVLDRPPRLFVTWELLDVSNGLPLPIDRGAR